MICANQLQLSNLGKYGATALTSTCHSVWGGGGDTECDGAPSFFITAPISPNSIPLLLRSFFRIFFGKVLGCFYRFFLFIPVWFFCDSFDCGLVLSDSELINMLQSAQLFHVRLKTQDVRRRTAQIGVGRGSCR